MGRALGVGRVMILGDKCEDGWECVIDGCA